MATLIRSYQIMWSAAPKLTKNENPRDQKTQSVLFFFFLFFFFGESISVKYSQTHSYGINKKWIQTDRQTKFENLARKI